MSSAILLEHCIKHSIAIVVYVLASALHKRLRLMHILAARVLTTSRKRDELWWTTLKGERDFDNVYRLP